MIRRRAAALATLTALIVTSPVDAQAWLVGRRVQPDPTIKLKSKVRGADGLEVRTSGERGPDVERAALIALATMARDRQALTFTVTTRRCIRTIYLARPSHVDCKLTAKLGDDPTETPDRQLFSVATVLGADR